MEKIELLKQKCAQEMKRCQKATEQCKRLEAELEALRKKMLGMTTEMKEGQKKLDEEKTQKAEQTQRADRLAGDLSKAKKELTSTTTRATKAEAEASDLEEEVDRLKKLLEDLEEQAEESERRAATAEAAGPALEDEMKGTVEDMEDKIAKLTMLTTNRHVMWEHQCPERSSNWIPYPEALVEKFEQALESQDQQFLAEVPGRKQPYKATVYPFNRLMIKLGDGMNLRMRRRKINRVYETIQHHDKIKPPAI